MTTLENDLNFFPVFRDCLEYIQGLFNVLLSVCPASLSGEIPQILRFQLLIELYDSFIYWLAFDDFQIKLLKGFTFILLANIVLILLAWKIYGRRINDRFIKPASSKIIEDLKKSLSLLKLPKEHSPRV